MKKKISLLLAVLMLTSLLVACQNDGDTTDPANGNDTTPPANTDSDNTQPQTSTQDSFNGVLAGDISSFNPKTMATSNDEVIHRQMYDPLLYVLEDKSIVPGLAESYEINEDSTVYTFKIRQGVKFHNGDILQPSDVVFSFVSYMDSPAHYSYVSGIDKVEIIEDNTVQITMKEPDAAFLQYLVFLGILNEKVVTESGENYDDNPVGTGPYKYVSYERANQIKLTRFDEYYRGPARIKDLTYRIMPDRNTQTISLQAGDIDFCNFDTASYENIAADPNLKIVEMEQTSIMMTLLNHEKAPFDNKLVRQAVCYAIDREFIIDANNGFGSVATNILPPSAFGYSADIEMGYTYDVAKAKDLIAQSGITVPMDIGAVVTVEAYKLRAEIMQQSLAAIGLNASVEIMELTRFGDEITAGNYTVAIRDMGTTGDAAFHSIILHSESIGGLNWARYNNPKVDELFAKGKAESNQEERVKIYTELFRITGEEVAYVPEFYPKSMLGMDKNLNIDEGTRIGLYLYDMYWSE